jgi:glycosyltransferase involved in cell wall biosynthesis
VKQHVVVGIPAFNEEKTIAKVILRAQTHADRIVVCDDGSTDLTGEIARRLGADVVRHEQNLGYGAAIKSLFRRAKELEADVLVTLDGDGQHDPEEIPKVVKPVLDGAVDVVVGSRFLDKHLAQTMPWYRRAGAKFITKLANNGSKNDVLDAQSGFRAYGRKSLEVLNLCEDGMGISTEILINSRQKGLRIREVPASCSYGKDLKTSTQNPVKHGVGLMVSIIKLVVEDKPLQVLGMPGIMCLLAGVFFGVWMLQVYAAEHQIVTNVALASLAFIMIGFFCLSTAITLYAISRLARKMNDR